ncbi:DNA-binding transcriptional regulator, LysR family [Roseomonas rosea]|uniref:DNA-binding transcriptional regulator, LysR family n=1 Tax=Muricoccus roseus TaxID=198092 RepID=A0A1M6R486_9PROT|nr:LysR family transcriptional regulator [Roseomonas rosea]SHK27157.1 DNA-binding transcriptional regulator, LysR family [Roseomonas rosea]
MQADPNQLNLRHLRAMLAIQDRRTLSAAAEAVSLSQPALTQGFAKLQAQFGHNLFHRTAGGITLTRPGEVLADRVRAAFGHLAAGLGRLPRKSGSDERLLRMTQVRALLALAGAAGYAPASREAGLSKTALHRAVGELEKDLGTGLTDRRGRGVCLNAAGRRLARGMRLALSEITAAISDLDDGAGTTLIRVGATPLSRCFLVPAAIARMAAEQPRVRFDVVEGGWGDLVEPLQDGILDMMVGGLRPVGGADAVQRPLYQDQLIIVAGQQHPLVGHGQPGAAALASYPWIVAKPNSFLRTQWEQLFQGGELPPAPIECGSVMIIGRLLTEGNFLTLLSPDQIALQVQSGLLATIGAPLRGTVRPVGLITRHGWRPSVSQRRFVELLEEIAAHRRTDLPQDPTGFPGYGRRASSP